MSYLTGFAALVLSTSLASATKFLNHASLLSGVDDPNWFENNVPILDTPDDNIQQVYYYRWTTYREHLAYTSPQYGYVSSEFLTTVSWSGPFGSINSAAGHHINEGRWLRDQKPGKDVVNFWLAGPGTWAKPQSQDKNEYTDDWAHEYSFWAGSAVWNQYLATGDADFAVGQLENLVKYYNKYDDHFNATLGLYFQWPVWDATEFVAASYEAGPGQEFLGGVGYRPSINSYQYGDARAIAAIAKLKGDTATAQAFTSKADSIQKAMLQRLWNSRDNFFEHRQRDNNPSGALLGIREYMGFIPWMFHVPNSGKYSLAWSALKDSQGFQSAFGPTTVEQRYNGKYGHFMYQAENCCRWDGPSWPFATAQILTAAENLLNDYPAQSYFTATDYYSILLTYAKTQYQDGKPYVAEAHHPSEDYWIYNALGHSEDYNHSTFIDNIIAGLLGIRPQSNDSLIVNPLVPSSWAYFGLENVPYHGHLVTVLWDKDGSRYKQGSGLTVWVDGKKVSSSANVAKVTIPSVGKVVKQTISPLVNVAVNHNSDTNGTQAWASYTSPYGGIDGVSPNDDPLHVIDGTIFRVAIAQNTRWTCGTTSNPSDWIAIDLLQKRTTSDIRLFFFADGESIQIPPSYDLQYSNDNSTWTTVPQQKRGINPPTNNAEVRITFPAISTRYVRVVAPNGGNGNGWGLSEFQVWAQPTVNVRNLQSGKSLASPSLFGRNVGEPTEDGLWRLISATGGWFKLQDRMTSKVLSASDAGEFVMAGEESHFDKQLWRFESRDDANSFVFINKDTGSSVSDGAGFWTFLP